MFHQLTYVERRKILQQKVEKGLILLFGNEESPMNYTDNTYHFRQDSTFLYYFGIQRPGLVALIDVERDREVIYGEEYTVEDYVWRGPQPTLHELASSCGIKEVRPIQELANTLSHAKASSTPVHFLPLYRAENQLKLQAWLGIYPQEINSKRSLDLVRAVISQREYKSQEEIEQLHRAVDVSVDMHVAAMRFAKPGMTEAQVTAEIHRVALAAGGNISFPIIATKDGQTLHNHYHGNTIQAGDLFLVDAGFENPMAYAGDLSSTFPLSATFTPVQKDIYQLTLDAHQAAIDALGLGIPFKAAHLAACRTIFDGLKAMGLTKGNTEDAVEAGAHALFFPCGTGHMMGLDVHDMEDLGEVWVGYEGQAKSTQFGLKSLRLAKPLGVGHVLTIEPGIYFIPELMDLWRGQGQFNEFIHWDKVNVYRDFGGIRNEEDFVMTEEGAQLLGKPKPKTIEEIETIRTEVYA
ncbi:MAG: aminopeptidase P N-terminal domain-containing protein [Saprospiraceae bacterium]|nr:aminopeptidase P N-terminal domain-containing protein [Saprospiraceae bacterium]